MKTVKGSKKQPVGSEIAAQGVDIEQLERLLAFMSEHGLEEFEYTKGDLRIRLKKSGAKQSAAPALPAPVASAAPAQILPPSPAPASAPAAPAPAAGATAEPAAAAANEHIIKSPIVGTFYAAASPEAGPFVRVGDFVEAGQTVCIIEAMKLMNEITSEYDGELVSAYVENGKPVQYGERLFAIKADV